MQYNELDKTNAVIAGKFKSSNNKIYNIFHSVTIFIIGFICGLWKIWQEKKTYIYSLLQVFSSIHELNSRLQIATLQSAITRQCLDSKNHRCFLRFITVNLKKTDNLPVKKKGSILKRMTQLDFETRVDYIRNFVVRVKEKNNAECSHRTAWPQ